MRVYIKDYLFCFYLGYASCFLPRSLLRNANELSIYSIASLSLLLFVVLLPLLPIFPPSGQPSLALFANWLSSFLYTFFPVFSPFFNKFSHLLSLQLFSLIKVLMESNIYHIIPSFCHLLANFNQL